MNEFEVAAYLDQQLPRDARNRVEAHIAECGDCRREVMEARQLMRRTQAPQRRRVFAGIAGLAAAALIAITLQRAGTDDDSRDLTRTATSAVTPMRVYGPLGEVPRSVLRFTWGAVAAATSYRLTVQAGGGATVWTATTADTTLTLPDSVVLTAAATYHWSVDALVSDGTTSTTGLRQFQPMR